MCATRQYKTILKGELTLKQSFESKVPNRKEAIRPGSWEQPSIIRGLYCFLSRSHRISSYLPFSLTQDKLLMLLYRIIFFYKSPPITHYRIIEYASTYKQYSLIILVEANNGSKLDKMSQFFFLPFKQHLLERLLTSTSKKKFKKNQNPFNPRKSHYLIVETHSQNINLSISRKQRNSSITNLKKLDNYSI